jgi:isoamylase
VYNHHEEVNVYASTTVGTIYSLRGLNNFGYYEPAEQRGSLQTYQNNTGVGPNVNAATAQVRDLVLTSLHYWSEVLGVDGFRFDLAAVLGNSKSDGGYAFDPDDPDNILNRAVKELPARPGEGGVGVDLIAEPYTADGAGQEQGKFPHGWSEWNDRFRDTIRASQNKRGIIPVTLGSLAMRMAGSEDLFRANDRWPWNSVNYVVSHDGFTLWDLHSYLEPRNNQAFPFGPSDGGRSAKDEMCWDHDGDPEAQQEAVRLSLALLLLATGVPMLTAGTEFNRTQYGDNNPYNLDTVANWIDWTLQESNAALFRFTQTLIQLRKDHSTFRPANFFTGKLQAASGIKDITWLRANGAEIDDGYFGDAYNSFLAFQLDGTSASDAASRFFFRVQQCSPTNSGKFSAFARGPIVAACDGYVASGNRVGKYMCLGDRERRNKREL